MNEVAWNRTGLTVLVTGASGWQGGAVARTLLARGHHVRAFTRRADGPQVSQLRQLGAELTLGSFDDQGSIERAAAGCDAVFAMAPSEAGAGLEIRQARAVLDAAKAARVGHVVYSSVASADRGTGVPLFDSKFQVEGHLRSLDVPFTIIGPAFFMENFLRVFLLPGLCEGRLLIAMSGTRTLQQIAVADIAVFTALVLEQREPFLGARIDIASDEVCALDAAEAITRASGKKIQYVELPLDAVRAGSEGMASMFSWYERAGFSADIVRLRRDYPEVGWHSFSTWAAEQNWTVLDT
ncbi:NmrA/HSCARG family protein [Sorangium sp. So ce204]|uniref:NmrA/HSCARG family protein n=1 Tax=Sorangium sp. So ce204 TaxID=3133288 RepID=UPI003F62CD5F